MNRLHSLLCSRHVVPLCFLFILETAVAQGPSEVNRSAAAPSAADLGLPSAEELATDLLAQFQRIYNERDAEEYVAMFDRWVFSYEFAQRDRSWGAPETWAYADEIRSARTMFEDPKTTRVELRLDEWRVEPADESLPGPDQGSVWKVTAKAYLKVERKTWWGETDQREINGHLHEFYFRRGTEDEGRAWKIVYWRDVSGPAARWKSISKLYQ
jgi:hypothetical protein